MLSTRWLYAVVCLATAATIGLAGPAWADDGLSGTYNYVNETGFTSTWTVTPCGSGCAHVFTSHSAANYDLRLSNGLWTASVDRPDAVGCPNGSSSRRDGQAAVPQQIAWSLLADLVVEGERVQCYPAQPSHKVNDESNIDVSGRHEIPR
jgi:hypothetical protein